MPRRSTKKAVVVFANAKPKGREYLIADEDGLALLVTPSGAKQWILRYCLLGKARKIHLKGSFPEMSVDQARKEKNRIREMISRNEDPFLNRKAEREQLRQRQEEAVREKQKTNLTFKAVADEWMEKREAAQSKATNRNNKERLSRFLIPYIGSKELHEITAPDLVSILNRIEDAGKNETAHRVLNLAKQIFAYAIAQGRVNRNIAADVRGSLQPVKSGHRAAILDPERLGKFLGDAERFGGLVTTKLYLRLLPYVFTRPSELREAQWTEFDFDSSHWDIPKERMKMRLPHRVPLSQQVKQLLIELRSIGMNGPYVFPSPHDDNKPISGKTLLDGLRQLGYTPDEQSLHGFRATARTLLDEKLRVEPKFIESQLAHRVPDALGTAYNRTLHLEEREAMMQRWADYLDSLKQGGTKAK